MANPLPKTLESIAAEISAHDAAAAAARLALLAAQSAENERRLPLHRAIQNRGLLLNQIVVNKRRAAEHRADFAEFGKKLDVYFANTSNDVERLYNLMNEAPWGSSNADGERAAGWIEARLERAEKELRTLEIEIRALAAKLNLQEFLPAELRN